MHLSGLLVKGGDEQEQAEQSDDAITLRHLDDRILETPSFAVENAILEVVHMGHIANENMERAFEAVMNYDKEKIEQVYRTEKVINKMEKLITEYLVKISNLSLNEDQHMVVNDLFYSVSDIERVGDHVENIVELMDVKEDGEPITFSEEGRYDLAEIMDLVEKSFVFSIPPEKRSAWMMQIKL